MPITSTALNYQQGANRSGTNDEDIRNLFLHVSANFDRGKANETNPTVTVFHC